MNVTATLPGQRAMARDRWRRAATGLMGLALAASPAYVVRMQVGPLPTTALEIALVVAIAVGLYAFWDELAWRSPYLLPAALLLTAATIVLNFWSETGLAGLVAFIWLGVQAVRQGLAGLALDRWPRTMSIGLLGMLFSLVLHGLVDAPYFKNDLALVFWALVAVQLGSLPRHRPVLTGP